MAMSSWRKDARSLEQLMEAALENCTAETPDISHDVTFIFTVAEEKVKVSCHKLFLALASPVFEAMFSKRHNCQNLSTGLETGDSHTSNELTNDLNKMSESTKMLEIEILDVQPVAFKNVIKYVYTRILDVDLKDCLATMYTAHKYDIPQLVEHCSHLLNSRIDNKNVVTYHKAALLLNDKELEKKSWEFIKEDVGGLLESKQLLELSEDDLCKLLKLDYMPNVISEVEVFNAILKWGNGQCEMKGEGEIVTVENVREVLKNAIPLIRFPTMAINDFNHVVEPSGILSERECIKLFKYFAESGQGSFKITGITGNIKLKAIGIVLPQMNAKRSNVKIRLMLYDLVEPNVDWAVKINTSTTKKVSKYLQICYVELDYPMTIESDVNYAVCVNVNEEGMEISNPVRFVNYKEESLNYTKISCSTNNQKLKLRFVPVDYVIWALEFQH